MKCWTLTRKTFGLPYWTWTDLIIHWTWKSMSLEKYEDFLESSAKQSVSNKIKSDFPAS